MKIFELLTKSLLITLVMAVSSCSKENTPEVTLESTYEAYLKKYGINTNDYEYSIPLTIDNILIFNGLKDSIFVASAYDTLSYKKLCEFIDTESTPKIVTKYIGYGESKELYLAKILNYGMVLTKNGYIGNSGILYIDNLKNEALEKQITYFSNGKRIESTNNDYSGWNKALVKKWFNDSAIVSDSICYNDKGDTLFITKLPIQYNETPITYTDGIIINFISKRINHATGEIIWESKLTSPYEIPSNAKNEIIILAKDNDFWKCKVNTLFYDGEKKDFTFEININNGTVKTLS